MEHPCYRCGVEIEEGTSFCPSCGAPQIRVRPRAEDALTEPAGAAIGVAEPANVEVPGASSQSGPQPLPSAHPPAGEFDWTDGLPSAGLGGLCGAGLALLPVISLFFPLWMAATGAFAVMFYRRRRHALAVSGSVGAKLGALAGTIGFVPFSLIVALEFLFMSRNGMLHDVFGRMVTSNADPQAQQQMQQVITWLQTPQGTAIAVVGALAFAFAGFLVLGTIGGAIWASVTKRSSA